MFLIKRSGTSRLPPLLQRHGGEKAALKKVSASSFKKLPRRPESPGADGAGDTSDASAKRATTPPLHTNCNNLSI